MVNIIIIEEYHGFTYRNQSGKIVGIDWMEPRKINTGTSL